MEQESNKKTDQKREIVKASNDDSSDISDDDIKSALSKLSSNELMVLDKLVNGNDFSNSKFDDQELVRESRSNKKRKDKDSKRIKNKDDNDDNDSDDDGDDDDSNRDAKETNDNDDDDDNSNVLDNIFNQQECFGANCKGGCIIKRIKIRGKRDSNTTTSSSTEQPPSSTATTIPSQSSQLVDLTIDSPKKSKRQTLSSNFNKRGLSYNPNLEKRIQGKITYLREKGKRNLKNHFDDAYRKKHNIGFNQYIRRKRESEQMAADNPKSPEHLKLLADSFPNTDEIEKPFQSNELLVRVKRDD